MSLKNVILYVRLSDHLGHMRLLPDFTPGDEAVFNRTLDSYWAQLSQEEKGAIEDVMLLIPRSQKEKT